MGVFVQRKEKRENDLGVKSWNNQSHIKMEKDAIAMFQKLGLFIKVPQLTTNEERLNFVARKCRSGKVLCDLLVKLDYDCFVRNQIKYNKNQQNLKMSEFVVS